MNKKDKQINIRLSKKDKEKIDFLSKEYGFESVSDYIIKSSLGTIKSKDNKRKIITLTLNPAVDYIVRTDSKLEEISNFLPDEKHFEPGGKGINASIIIDQFNGRTLAIHHSGGFTGELIKESLSSMNIQQLQVPSEDVTRINMKLNFKDESYEINSKATPLTKTSITKIVKVIKTIDKGDVLMVMGSYHESNETLLKEISEIAKERGAEVVYDLSKPYLKELLKYKPLIVKPNKEELEMIIGKKINSQNEMISNMKEMQKAGAQNVALTMGKDGAILLDSKGNLYKATVDPVTLVSPQGSGDSFIATFVYKIEEGIEEAFKWANAAGAATAQIHGLADYNMIKSNVSGVHLTKIK